MRSCNSASLLPPTPPKVTKTQTCPKRLLNDLNYRKLFPDPTILLQYDSISHSNLIIGNKNTDREVEGKPESVRGYMVSTWLF